MLKTHKKNAMTKFLYNFTDLKKELLNKYELEQAGL